MRTPKSWSNYSHRADLYARRVCGDTTAGGAIIAGPLVRLACRRHLNDRDRARKASSEWEFSDQLADKVINFFELVIRLPDTTDEHGQPPPFILEPFQAFIVGSLFGWINRSTGRRRFREAYISTGKGSGKSPLAAGLAWFGLLGDGELAPEVYVAATTRVQAQVVYRMAENMRLVSPEILGSGVIKTQNNLGYNLGFIRSYSRDQGRLSGPLPSLAILDEVHEHPNGDICNLLIAGFKRREQPLAFLITNAGFDRTSFAWYRQEHAERVLTGIVTDDHLFAYVCALDKGDDPLNDPSVWPKTNPLMPISPSVTYLQDRVSAAKNIPTDAAKVMRLNFCQWTQQETRAIDMSAWDLCRGLVDRAELTGVPCFGGLDLGQVDDFTSFARVWMLPDGRIAVSAHHWLPEAAILKYPSRPYDAWRRQGLLTITQGDSTDFSQVRADVAALCADAGTVAEVAFDPYVARETATGLEGHGVQMVEQPQGFTLNEATGRLLEAVASGQIHHGGDEILGWMASNLTVRHAQDGRIRPDKQRSGEKIDGIVAVIMALGRAILQPVVDPDTSYEIRVI
mgnify:CR=1 FL=1|jgi:phage terminase large subunit-like protein